MRTLATTFLLLCLCVVNGCSLPTGLLRSRWAMDDPDYASKYAVGAEKTDVAGKLKQAADARFIEGASGLYASAGASSRSDSDNTWGLVEIGAESYAASFLTIRGALMAAATSDDFFTGLDVGMRLQSPSRLAPFVGFGAFVGTADEEVPAENDWIDNDEDGFVDERGEERSRFSGALAAIYPEAGVHLWWTPNLRLTGFGRYFVTSEGRRNDDWLIGASLAVFSK